MPLKKSETNKPFSLINPLYELEKSNYYFNLFISVINVFSQ